MADDVNQRIEAARQAHQAVLDTLDRHRMVQEALGGETGWWTDAAALDGRLELHVRLRDEAGALDVEVSEMLHDMIRENMPLFLLTLIQRTREAAERLVLPPQEAPQEPVVEVEPSERGH